MTAQVPPKKYEIILCVLLLIIIPILLVFGIYSCRQANKKRALEKTPVHLRGLNTGEELAAAEADYWVRLKHFRFKNAKLVEKCIKRPAGRMPNQYFVKLKYEIKDDSETFTEEIVVNLWFDKDRDWHHRFDKAWSPEYFEKMDEH